VNHSFSRPRYSMAVAMLAGLIALPVAAMDDATFLRMTNQQAAMDSGEVVAEPVASAARGSAASKAAIVVAPAVATTDVSDASAEAATEVTAARLGVTTPYGKKALVQELRNYYPGSYSTFRGLSREQVNELVRLFSAGGDLNQVLAKMDRMASN